MGLLIIMSLGALAGGLALSLMGMPIAVGIVFGALVGAIIAREMDVV